MKEVFAIRAVSADEDLLQIQALAHAIWPAVYADLLPPGQLEFMLHGMYDLEVMQADLRAGVTYLLATVDGTPVGYAAWGPADDGYHKLHKLYLLAAVRGKGYGRQLIETVKTQIRAAGGHRLKLHVNKHNTASIRAYEACGLRQLAAVKVDIGDGFYMDDYIMGGEL